MKLVNLSGHDGAAPPPPAKFIYFQGKSQVVKACVQASISPRENSEKEQLLSDFSWEVGEGGTRANWLEKNILQKNL